MANILYVEDDETLSFVTKDHLETKGYDVFHFPNGQLALDALDSIEYDLALLDVMLPEMDGFTLAGHIREKNQEVPILFLTAKAMMDDRLQGFKLGGDDYITKPFSMEELLMRIEVFLRRRKLHEVNAEQKFVIGKFTFDYANLQLKDAEGESTLTQKEADLLQYFAIHPNRVLKRANILTEIWGDDDYFLGRSLDVFISRLRKYLKTDESIKIENVHGVGFKFLCDGVEVGRGEKSSN